MRTNIKSRLSKLEDKSSHKQKQLVLSTEGIVYSPESLKGKNITSLNEDEYMIVNIVRV